MTSFSRVLFVMIMSANNASIMFESAGDVYMSYVLLWTMFVVVRPQAWYMEYCLIMPYFVLSGEFPYAQES